MGGKPPSMLVMDQMEDNVMFVFMCDQDKVPIGRGDVLPLRILLPFQIIVAEDHIVVEHRELGEQTDVSPPGVQVDQGDRFHTVTD